MTEYRWSKFWWQDWQADQALRSCSLAARGLWIDMLCIAHSGTPRGHVTINGQPVTPKRLSILVGVSERECSRLLRELEEAGVFSKTADGVIFSRRMVRDTDQSNEGRQAIEKRWNRAADPITPPNTPPNSPPTHNPNTLEAEAESEAERKKERKKEGQDFCLGDGPCSAEPVGTEQPPEPSWPPPPLPSAVTAVVDVLAAKLEGRHRTTRIAAPHAPVRDVDAQLAAIAPSRVKPKFIPVEQLAEARARLAKKDTAT